MPVEEMQVPESIRKIKQIREVLFSMRDRLQPVLASRPSGMAKPTVSSNTPLMIELEDLLDVAETLRADISL